MCHQAAGGHAKSIVLLEVERHGVRRTIGLALVDEWRGGVQIGANHARRQQRTVRQRRTTDRRDSGASQGHRIERVAHWEGGIEIHVPRQQWNGDGAAAALGDEIEAVVKELAKNRHQGIEWRHENRRIPGISKVAVIGGKERIVHRRVDYEIADDARRGVVDVACRIKRANLSVVVGGTSEASPRHVAENRCRDVDERLVDVSVCVGVNGVPVLIEDRGVRDVVEGAVDAPDSLYRGEGRAERRLRASQNRSLNYQQVSSVELAHFETPIVKPELAYSPVLFLGIFPRDATKKARGAVV